MAQSLPAQGLLSEPAAAASPKGKLVPAAAAAPALQTYSDSALWWQLESSPSASARRKRRMCWIPGQSSLSVRGDEV